MSDKLFIKGTLILTLTGLVSRLMGSSIEYSYLILLVHRELEFTSLRFRFTQSYWQPAVWAFRLLFPGCVPLSLPLEKKKSPEMHCFLEHFFRWHFADFYLFWSIGMQILWLLLC